MLRFLSVSLMRSAYAYKAVLYRDSSLAAGFWTGRAVDKQINNAEQQISNYWNRRVSDGGSIGI